MKHTIDWRDDNSLKITTRDFEQEAFETVRPDVVDGEDVWRVASDDFNVYSLSEAIDEAVKRTKASVERKHRAGDEIAKYKFENFDGFERRA